MNFFLKVYKRAHYNILTLSHIRDKLHDTITMINAQFGAPIEHDFDWDDDERGGYAKVGSTRTTTASAHVPDATQSWNESWNDMEDYEDRLGDAGSARHVESVHAGEDADNAGHGQDSEPLVDYDTTYDDDGEGEGSPDIQFVEDASDDVRFYKFMYT